MIARPLCTLLQLTCYALSFSYSQFASKGIQNKRHIVGVYQDLRINSSYTHIHVLLTNFCARKAMTFISFFGKND